MDLKIEIKGRIQKPLSEVFDAVYNPKKLASYFVTAGASAPLDEGSTVTWEFADFPGPFPVIVKQSVKNERLVIQWDASSPLKDGTPYKTTVTFTFEKLHPTNTLVTITEEGFEESENGLKDSRSNAPGWMHMLTCMKAYLEYGINLRTGMFK